jgi:hypothetical protein
VSAFGPCYLAQLERERERERERQITDYRTPKALLQDVFDAVASGPAFPDKLLPCAEWRFQ